MAKLTVQQLHDKTTGAEDGLKADADAMKSLDAEYADRSKGIEASRDGHEHELEASEGALTEFAKTLTGVVTDIVEKDGRKVALIKDGSVRQFHFAEQVPATTEVEVPDDLAAPPTPPDGTTPTPPAEPTPPAPPTPPTPPDEAPPADRPPPATVPPDGLPTPPPEGPPAEEPGPAPGETTRLA